MAKLIVQRFGNSIGIILPEECGLHEGDSLEYTKKSNSYLLTKSDAVCTNRRLIEESFADFEAGNVLTEEQMNMEFGKYGWGE